VIPKETNALIQPDLHPLGGLLGFSHSRREVVKKVPQKNQLVEGLLI
jgi:hypothetical protein